VRFLVNITERLETSETGELPIIRDIQWSGEATDRHAAEDEAWTAFDAKYGTEDRPPAQIEVVEID